MRPVHHHMDVVGDDVIEQALVVGDEKDADVRAAQGIHAAETILSASMSRPLSVSSSTA